MIIKTNNKLTSQNIQDVEKITGFKFQEFCTRKHEIFAKFKLERGIKEYEIRIHTAMIPNLPNAGSFGIELGENKTGIEPFQLPIPLKGIQQMSSKGINK